MTEQQVAAIEARGLRRVLFDFNTDAPWRGWTDGSRWNGWLNVWTTPETARKIVARFRQDASDEEGLREMEGLIAESALEDGLVCWGWCYCTREWECGCRRAATWAYPVAGGRWEYICDDCKQLGEDDARGAGHAVTTPETWERWQVECFGVAS